MHCNCNDNGRQASERNEGWHVRSCHLFGCFFISSYISGRHEGERAVKTNSLVVYHIVHEQHPASRISRSYIDRQETYIQHT